MMTAPGPMMRDSSNMPEQAAEANHLMSGLDWNGAVEDVRAAATWLKSQVRFCAPRPCLDHVSARFYPAV
jgi:hypothetical protein